MLVQALLNLASAAVGLLVADSVLDDMSVSWDSFVLVVVIFTVLQAVLSPFLLKVAARNAPPLVGGIGLISTFVALLITALVDDGLRIDGWSTWVYASLIVWIVTMIAVLLLPLLLVKLGVESARQNRGT